jgi:SnoaL-like domain
MPLAKDAASEIELLLVRYATAIDTRDWDLFHRCFTDDATTDYEEVGSWSDLDGIVRFMKDAHIGFAATNHMMCNIVVEMEGAGARARSYVHAVLAFNDDPGWIDCVGTFRDELVLTTDGWRIARRTFRVTRLLTGPWPQPALRGEVDTPPWGSRR